MSMSQEQIIGIVTSAVDAMTEELYKKIELLTKQFEQLNPRVETYEPVTLTAEGRENSLELIKSLPEFKGDVQSYPAWRDAAHFAINYYNIGSENYYMAMGIFRNKIVGAANAKLSSFNTVLNFQAIIARLDKCYADKRSLQALENELSILRQGGKSLTEFYDAVDEQLTLIINKNLITYSDNTDIVAVLNDRARDNALRVFISGLRRPLSDILFSAKPVDLPTALVTAQELESDQRRREFARIYAAGGLARTNYSLREKVNGGKIAHQSYRFTNGLGDSKGRNIDVKPTPMDIDPGSSIFKQATNYKPGIHKTIGQQYSRDNNVLRDNFKRKYEDSSRALPNTKTQRINHLESDSDEFVEISSLFEFDQNSDEIEDLDEHINFLD